MDGRKVTGLTNGSVTAGSSDAINGGELYNTATSYLGILGVSGSVYTDGLVTGGAFSVGGTTVNEALTNIYNSTTNIITSNTTINNLVTGSAGLWRYNSLTGDITISNTFDGAVLSIANADGSGATRLLTGLTDGEISGASVDAINGSQLYNLGTSIANILGSGTLIGDTIVGDVTIGDTTYNNFTDAITNLYNSGATINNTVNNIASGSAGIYRYDSATGDITIGSQFSGTLVNFSGANAAGQNVVARLLTGVAAGTINGTSVDAINGSQLYNLGASVAKILGSGTLIDGEIVGDVTVGGATFNNFTDALTNLYNSSITIDNTERSIVSGSTGIYRYDSATGDITIGSEFSGTIVNFSGADAAGANVVARQLAGVAPGEINGTSVDAVNGSQLHALGSEVAASFGGSASYADGAWAGPTYVLGSNTYNNVGDALNNLYDISATFAGDALMWDSATNAYNAARNGADQRITGVAAGVADNDAVNVAQLKAAGIISGTDGKVANVVTYDDDTKNQITLGGTTSTDGGVTNGTVISNVAQGALSAASTEAVNGSQLYETNQRVSNIEDTVNLISNSSGMKHFSTGNDDPNSEHPATATGGSAVAAGMGASASGAQSSALGDFSTASAPQTTALGYSANASASNATALGANSQASGVNSTAIGANAMALADNSVAIGANSVATDPNTVSFGNAAAGQYRRLVNIADGIDAHDAVNMSQLTTFANEVNQNFDNVCNSINKLGNRLDAVGAMTAAMGQAQLRLSPQENRGEIALGIGGYRGHGAFAMNYGYTSRRGDRGVQAGFALSDRGDVMGGAGCVFGW